MGKCLCGHGKKWHFTKWAYDECYHEDENGRVDCPCSKYRPAKKAEYEFDFCVSGLSKEQAQTLLDLIVDAVVMGGGHIGGGFHEVTE